MKVFDDKLNIDIIKGTSFKEDSVREEIIAPILKHLGYSAFSANKIIRSKHLEHPYVQFGTKREHISIIPDYLLQVDEKNVFVLDAKSPSENILDGKNPEQAFSYAIHREICAEKYALCNGLEFIVFDIKAIKPILHLKIEEIEEKWNELYKVLSPISFTKPHLLNYKPDFGIWCIKSGMRKDTILHFIDCEVGPIGRVDETKYTFSLSMPEGIGCLASFDFYKNDFDAFISQVPSDKKDIVKNSLTRQPFMYSPTKESESFRIDFSAVLGSEVEENEEEIFIPLKVKSFG